MLLPILATALVAAAPPNETRLVLTPLRAAGIPEDVTALTTERFTQDLESRGIRIVTPAQIDEQLDLSKRRQLLGCLESLPSCVTELVNTLGADGVILFNLVEAPNGYKVKVRVLSRVGTQVASDARTVAGGQELLDGLSKVAESIAGQIKTATLPGVSTVTTEKFRLSSYAWAPAVAAGALAIGSAVAYAGVAERYSILTDRAGSTRFLAARQAAREGAELQLLGGVLAGSSAACLALAATFFFAPPGANPSKALVFVVPASSGGAVVVQGRLP